MAAGPYEEAICKLNMLQRKPNEKSPANDSIRKTCNKLQNMENYLSRIGITLEMLDSLSVVHVAGTKGKGSTCAMCESILRHHGFRTGFYSSPHLFAVRERIRVDGRVVSEDKFASYFYDVYNKLDQTKAHEKNMPGYFLFLTVLAFHVFIMEGVDVAIIEVGIGGATDATNILRKVPIVGITSLGLDHTQILGDTLSLIAEAKAGIMKVGCQAFTVSQPSDAMEVLYRVAGEVQCQLKIVPEYKSYQFPKQYKNILPADVKACQRNASLAIQLAHAWLQHKEAEGNLNHIRSLLIEVPETTTVGLKECRWPGRYHILQEEYATFYLDGAHTKESMELCAEWYKNSCREHQKVLIFTATGHRDVEVLLKPLIEISFDIVYFVMPRVHSKTDVDNDNYYANEQGSKCRLHAQIWKDLHEGWKEIQTVMVINCISDAINCIRKLSNNNTECGKSVLVAGSIHLVGSFLSILQPNLIDG